MTGSNEQVFIADVFIADIYIKNDPNGSIERPVISVLVDVATKEAVFNINSMSINKDQGGNMK